MDNRSNLMTEGDYRKKIILFAIPVFIGQLFQQMYNTVDSLIVGRFLGKNALAAVSSTGSLTYLLIGFFMGFSLGAGIIIARYIGARNQKSASNAVHTTVAMGLSFSLFISLMGYFFTPTLLRWMGSPIDVIDLSTKYLQVYFAGSTGMIMYNTMVGILQASGDSKHPLYFLIISSIINIGLDFLFIGYLKMGVEAAAYATIIAQFISMFLALNRLMHENEFTRISVKKIRFDFGILRQIIHYGLPAALQASVIDISNMLIQSYVNSFGSVVMAGVGAYSKIEGFAFLPTNAFSMATSTFVSQNIGAKKYDRVKKGIYFSLGLAIILISIIGVGIYFNAPKIISLFNNDPEVIKYGVLKIKYCSLFYALVGFSHITSAIMRGIGKPMMPTIVMLICWCLVRILVLMTIGQFFHYIELAFVIYPITWALSTISFIVLYKKYVFKFITQLE